MSDTVNYDSSRTFDEMLECMADHVTDKSKDALCNSPYVAVMIDETTDIANKIPNDLYKMHLIPYFE